MKIYRILPIAVAILSILFVSVGHSKSKDTITVKEVKLKYASKNLRGYRRDVMADTAGSYDLCDNDSFTLLDGPSDDIEADRANIGIDCTGKTSFGRYTHISSVTGKSYLSDTMKIPAELIEDNFNASNDPLHRTSDLGYFGYEMYYQDMKIPNSSKIIAIKDTLNISDNRLLGLAINNTGLVARDVEVKYRGESYTVPYTIQPGEVFPFEIPTYQNKVSYGQIKFQSSLSERLGLGRAFDISGYGLQGILHDDISSLSAEDKQLLGDRFDLLSTTVPVVVFSPLLELSTLEIVVNKSFVQPPVQIDGIAIVVAFFDENSKVVHLVQPKLFLSDYNGDDHYYTLSDSQPFDRPARFAFTNPDSTVEWENYGIWVGGKD